MMPKSVDKDTDGDKDMSAPKTHTQPSSKPTTKEEFLNQVGNLVTNEFIMYVYPELIYRHWRKRGDRRGMWTFSYKSPFHVATTNENNETRLAHFNEWNWMPADVMRQNSDTFASSTALAAMEEMDPTKSVLLVWSVNIDQTVEFFSAPECVFQMTCLSVGPGLELLAKMGKDMTVRETQKEEATCFQLQHNQAEADIVRLKALANISRRTCAMCGVETQRQQSETEKKKSGKKEAKPKFMSMCSGCRCVSYCCREHQKKHWSEGGHKLVCLKMKEERLAHKQKRTKPTECKEDTSSSSTSTSSLASGGSGSTSGATSTLREDDDTGPSIPPQTQLDLEAQALFLCCGHPGAMRVLHAVWHNKGWKCAKAVYNHLQVVLSIRQEFIWCLYTDVHENNLDAFVDGVLALSVRPTGPCPRGCNW
jgi:hypothetical protein